MRHILIILSFLFLSSPVITKSQRPEIIIISVSSKGDVSKTRNSILQNTLTQELSKHFEILPQERFEQVQEEARE